MVNGVSVLTFLAILLAGVGVWDLMTAPKRRLQTILARVGRLEVEQPPAQRLVANLKERVIGRLPLLPGAGSMDELRSLVLWAGRPWGLSAEEFYFLQYVLAVVVGGLLASSGGLAGAAIGGIAGLLLPRWWLRSKVAQISLTLRRQLPSFVHLLATCLEAGLGLTQAVKRVAEESPGLLSREMLRTVHEMAAGKPSQRAWRDLMERHNCPELNEVINGLMQSQEYGVGIADQLRITMRQIRERKKQQASQKAQEASVKMRVPMVLFIMLPTLVVVLGPAVVDLAREFGGGL
ncbi:MAG TPA: type II secretion system F family protein [Symbiobacteriaceae bacterium]|jgi:tight adherence protein C|nr:type II secretion system F family protein [Symbiobacteriaceae bacterium]